MLYGQIETKRISDDEKAALKRRRQKAEKRLKEEETKVRVQQCVLSCLCLLIAEF